jgi:hypothetical protein
MDLCSYYLLIKPFIIDIIQQLKMSYIIWFLSLIGLFSLCTVTVDGYSRGNFLNNKKLTFLSRYIHSYSGSYSSHNKCP